VNTCNFSCTDTCMQSQFEATNSCIVISHSFLYFKNTLTCQERQVW
jgi:hypothetical protein